MNRGSMTTDGPYWWGESTILPNPKPNHETPNFSCSSGSPQLRHLTHLSLNSDFPRSMGNFFQPRKSVE